jgi:hypothetical protein
MLKIDEFVKLANKHNQNIIFVLFDDCWKSEYQSEPQPDPISGVHNSQ